MLLSLSHSCLSLSPKTPTSPSPPFLSPTTLKPSPRYQNPKPPNSSLRTSKSTLETLGESALQRISEKLRSLGYLEENPDDPPPTGRGSAGEIFVPTPHDLPKHRVGHTIDSSWSTPDHPVPEPGANIARFHDLRRKSGDRPKPTEMAMPTVAELTLPAGELRRLRTVGIRLEKRLKVGKAGITEGIVNGIHERWRRSELVKIKCEDLCRMNMKRTHETLERKTGGLVVWRSGSIIILYRGANYRYPYFCEEEQRDESIDELSDCSMDDGTSCKEEGSLESKIVQAPSESLKTSTRTSIVIGVGSPKKVRLQLPGEVQLEDEFDRLLDGLGPRFDDWWGCDPLPIDADLLPPMVPGFRKPFRLLPFGVLAKLTDREMTILRRLGRPLPCHFALGRNRNLQGLAVSMIKLWEKCEIGKIAVKRGVQNTNSEIMAEELKRLTGGTVLSRDKDFIVFYRGKDFLPPAVSVAIQERRKCEIDKREQNMAAKEVEQKVLAIPASEPSVGIPASEDVQEAVEQKRSIIRLKRQTSPSLAVQRVESSLSQALENKEKAEKLLAELEKSVKPPVMESDREGISEEERYMLRKVGLRMKPFLLLGRRGVFAGTVENMHLHWKYRELVKIISNDRSFQHVYDAARTLEAESGGILVAVDRVSKGYAIIVYRGKNYRRPAHLRPKTLLNKKEAMKRSLEAQRCESLKLHVLSLSKKIDHFKHQMNKGVSPADSVQLIQHDASDITVEKNTSNGPTELNSISGESMCQQDNLKKVDEVDAESLQSNEHDLSSDTGAFNMPTNEQAQFSHSTTSHTSHFPDKDSTYLSLEVTQRKPESYVHDKLGGKLDGEIAFKAAPLSNRERLILRKQALKMKKRPVLAVGRSNIVAGVAKTIKTHFRKHPLAIVNIKGVAKGTSVHELIFELEQATGAVLVSREPNKVILYRGWGEGEVAGGASKGKGAAEKTSVVSPQLMAAIRREIGLE